MKYKLLIIIVFLSIFLIQFVDSTCTLTLDKTNYTQGETASVTAICDTSTEKSKEFTMDWHNGSGYLMERDTGTTPATVGQAFFESYTVPTNYVLSYGINLSVNMTGSNLEGIDSAEIGSGISSSLKLTNFSGTPPPILVGRIASINFIVTDENDLLITGAKCSAHMKDENEAPLIINQKDMETFDGEVSFSQLVNPNALLEDTQYLMYVHCSCGASGTDDVCFDETGIEVSNSIGTSSFPFKVDRWLNVNTLTDKSHYELKEEVFIGVNVTNVNWTKRIPIHIYSQVRCSNGEDINSDIDRTLIWDTGETPSQRGINVNTTQIQGEVFSIPELKYLEGQNSTCYASTDTWVINDDHEEIFGYATTSPMFYIFSDELNLDPDWQYINNKTLNSIVNLSDYKYEDYNGTGTGKIDLRLASSYAQYLHDIRDSFDIFNSISNITIKNGTSTLTEHTDYELEYLDDGNIEVELRDVTLSKYTGLGWWNITLKFENYELRNVEALEGIESRTGTFHLSVDCPTQGTIGNSMSCLITAYVEDTQTVQKEVDFTCYISDGTNTYSSTNFNQMISRTPVTLTKTFNVPSSFVNGDSYLLQCHADYYNLGSRRDSFYDSFTAVTATGGAARESGSGGGTTEDEEPSEDEESPEDDGGGLITGDVVFDDIFDEFPMKITEKNWWAYLLVVLILIGLIFYFGRDKRRHHRIHHKETNHFKIILTIVVAFILAIILFLIYLLIKNRPPKSVIPTSELACSYSFVQDPLFRTIILVTFFAIIIIILFKTLKIRGQIKFGEDYSVRKFYDDKEAIKDQQKINKLILKDELRRKREESKEKHRIIKMNKDEFAKFIRKNIKRNSKN